jgi:DNA-directed RNA polymerase sigma subunit (sigma70/sigma32)
MTYEEMSKHMGISPQACEQICKKAMDKIRAHLKAHPEKAEALFNFLIESNPHYYEGRRNE